MGSSLSPSSVAALTTAAHGHRHRYHLSSSSSSHYYEDDGFEFTPLLPRPRRRPSARTERPRTVAQAAATTAAQPQPPQLRARRGAPSVVAATPAAPPTPRKQQVRWHDMAFGSARVPAAMDMGEIRRRLRARQLALAGGAAGNERPPSSSAAGWAPWRLIRSLSCKGLEPVAAAAAPVRLPLV
jgi:hypothetical protein